MSKYTIEVYSLLKDNKFNMFDFDYLFYSDNEYLKSNFESKFLDTYMFHEIGQETVSRFKHYLRAKLNNIMPYYKQLYETELRCQNIDFMLNKDLTETFERLITSDKEGQTDNNSKADITSQDTSNLTNATNENNKESYLEQGLASISVNDKLTGVTNTTNNIEQNNISNKTGSNVSQGTSRTVESSSDKEVTKLISQGNIGVTSSAELLDKWRKVIINIDNLIIEECSSLFMQIY